MLQKYALSLILSNANVTCESLGLDLAVPLTTNEVTFLQYSPKTNGISGRARFLDRYEFIVNHSKFQTFRDLNYWEASKTKRPENSVESPGTALSTEEVEGIARGAIRSLGFKEQELNLKEPPTVNQLQYIGPGGEVVKLPQYDVRWRPAPGYAGLVEIQVSSITKKPTEIFIPWWTIPPVDLPDGYDKLLSEDILEQKNKKGVPDENEGSSELMLPRSEIEKVKSESSAD